MRRKLLAGVAVLAIGCLCVGCMGITRNEFQEGVAGKIRAANGGFRNISRFVDRHFFNYTWDDPYAFEDVYAGR